jgi:hypothetical protein
MKFFTVNELLEYVDKLVERTLKRKNNPKGIMKNE